MYAAAMMVETYRPTYEVGWADSEGQEPYLIIRQMSGTVYAVEAHRFTPHSFVEIADEYGLRAAMNLLREVEVEVEVTLKEAELSQNEVKEILTEDGLEV
jgi:hypothetical protein